jgi:hypothetical protein
MRKTLLTMLAVMSFTVRAVGVPVEQMLTHKLPEGDLGWFSGAYYPNENDTEYWRVEIKELSYGKSLVFYKENEKNSTCRLPHDVDSETIEKVIKVQTGKTSTQRIKAKFLCMRYTDSHNTFLVVYPETKAGSNFITNEFKKSKKVGMYLDEDIVNFTAIHFIAHWEAFTEAL